MIENYIFDFGNVLGEFYPERLTAPFVADKEIRKFISDIAFDRLYWDKLDVGTISDEQVREGIRSRVPEKMGDLACRVYDNWINSMTPVKNMAEIISKIRNKGKRLYLLSNISIGFAENYKYVPWIYEMLSKFDGLVFSGTVGMGKPDKCIFEYLLQKYDLKAEECFFVDDNENNIKTAKSIGIEGYLFDGDADKLGAFLKI